MNRILILFFINVNSLNCNQSKLEKYFKDDNLVTYREGNIVRIECPTDFFPSSNGSPLDEIECSQTGWSLPQDMQPVTCEPITCPPVPEFGKDIESKCQWRHTECSGRSDGEDCQCTFALFSCKKDSWEFRPAFQLKNEKNLNVSKWFSFYSLSCERFEKTNYGKWKVYNKWFPDDAAVTCKDYAECSIFRGKDNQVTASCENHNGFHENCDRLTMSCPKGMKPTADFVTCERLTYECCGFGGKWKYPAGVKKHKISCVEVDGIDEEIPTAEPTNKLCEDLTNQYYDDTVDVTCAKDNSVCIFTCKDSGVPNIPEIKCKSKKGKWMKQKKQASCRK